VQLASLYSIIKNSGKLVDSKVLYQLHRLITLYLLVSLYGCTNLFFQPNKQLLVSPEQLGIDYEDIHFKSIDNLDLHGWWFPAEGTPKALILFLHGNAHNISTHSAAVHWLTKHQYEVFIFDYRGYGLSHGTPELAPMISDIHQAYLYANQHKSKGLKLYVMGQSLGASMGIYSLANHSQTINDGIDGLIFVSPFSDYRKITRNMLSNSWLTWAFQWPLSFTINNDYRPLDYVQKLPRVPVLYMYSNNDRVIPPEQVKTLFKNTIEPKFIEQLKGPHSSIFAIESNRKILLKYLDDWSKHN